MQQHCLTALWAITGPLHRYGACLQTSQCSIQLFHVARHFPGQITTSQAIKRANSGPLAFLMKTNQPGREMFFQQQEAVTVDKIIIAPPYSRDTDRHIRLMLPLHSFSLILIYIPASYEQHSDIFFFYSLEKANRYQQSPKKRDIRYCLRQIVITWGRHLHTFNPFVIV